jgi:hypothetical protein
MARYENPQVELMEVLGNWGFDPSCREPQDAYPTGNNICVLPDSIQTCPIISERPLTVIDGHDKDYVVSADESRIVGRTESLTTAEALIFSKYGIESLVPSDHLFPENYLKEEDGK